MRRMMPLLALLVFVPFSSGGPLEKVKRFERRSEGDERVQVPAGSPGKRKVGPIAFKGGERAMAIAMGDHRPPVDLGLEVYDDKNRLVASSLGKGDFAAVVWHPIRDGSYTIQILNPSLDFNLVYLVVK